MSHIPSSAMPHAKAVEPEDGTAVGTMHKTDDAASTTDTPPVVIATLGGAVEDAAPAVAETPARKAAETKPAGAGSGSGWGLIAALAGGAVALGAVAAAAVPLVRGHAAPKRERRERKADRKTRKAKAKG